MLWNLLVLIVVTFGNMKINALDDYRVVDTKYGKIRGIRSRTILDQVDYYSFRGIYYAKNPVGNLRFKVRNMRKSRFAFSSSVIRDCFDILILCPRLPNQLNHGPRK